MLVCVIHAGHEAVLIVDVCREGYTVDYGDFFCLSAESGGEAC